MNVLIPTALLSYTGQSRVEAQGDTIDAVLADLDRRYPGIRFRVIDEQGRIRRNIRFAADGTMVEELSHPLRPDGELCIIQALSGGGRERRRDAPVAGYLSTSLEICHCLTSA